MSEKLSSDDENDKADDLRSQRDILGIRINWFPVANTFSYRKENSRHKLRVYTLQNFYLLYFLFRYIKKQSLINVKKIIVKIVVNKHTLLTHSFLISVCEVFQVYYLIVNSRELYVRFARPRSLTKRGRSKMRLSRNNPRADTFSRYTRVILSPSLSRREGSHVLFRAKQPCKERARAHTRCGKKAEGNHDQARIWTSKVRVRTQLRTRNAITRVSKSPSRSRRPFLARIPFSSPAPGMHRRNAREKFASSSPPFG